MVWLRELVNRCRQWFRRTVYKFAVWLLARVGPKLDAVDDFLGRENDPKVAQAAAELYHRGFINGMNSRGVPSDLLIHGQSALKNADWVEIDTVARAAAGGFYMTRNVPVRPVSGRKESNDKHHNRTSVAGNTRDRNLGSRRQGR